jgi:hypothetical protein
MPDSMAPSRQTPPPSPSADNDGHWELDLWSGSTVFSDWFDQRLQWPVRVGNRRLDDLRPHLEADDWDALLQAIRRHLERRAPLDLAITVRVADGGSERWRVQGSAERTAGGQPVHVSGTARAIEP